jgi:hypothetical protein
MDVVGELTEFLDAELLAAGQDMASEFSRLFAPELEIRTKHRFHGVTPIGGKNSRRPVTVQRLSDIQENKTEFISIYSCSRKPLASRCGAGAAGL